MDKKDLDINFVPFTDGGARGNPGPSAAGIFLYTSDKSFTKEIGVYLGKGTNNEAEYEALIYGLTKAKQFKIKELTCYADSELMVRQVNGLYKINNERI